MHGGGGADFMDADPEAVATITAAHARHGTTALLATTLTAPEAEIIAAIRTARSAPQRGARILGFHIEGPFINPVMQGAQDGRFIRPADPAEIDRWLAAGGPGQAWQMTLAPEGDGALTTIRHLAIRGAVVSAGHTDCTYAQLAAAQAAGLSHVTHLYNAMRGLHHREPGTVGGALSLPGLTVEVIADGIHVHPAALTVALRVRGSDAVILVTDAMRAAAMPDGEYRLGQRTVRVAAGAAPGRHRRRPGRRPGGAGPRPAPAADHRRRGHGLRRTLTPRAREDTAVPRCTAVYRESPAVPPGMF